MANCFRLLMAAAPLEGAFYEDIASALGGLDHLSEGQKQLIRRAAMLSAESERLEATATRGEAEFNVDLYGQMYDRLGRCRPLWLSRSPIAESARRLAHDEINQRRSNYGPRW
jgi:hypothetical protein